MKTFRIVVFSIALFLAASFLLAQTPALSGNLYVPAIYSIVFGDPPNTDNISIKKTAASRATVTGTLAIASPMVLGTSLRVASDVASTDSTNFADVTGLTFPVAASTKYSFSCQISYTTAVSTTALHLSVNGPASPTALDYSVVTATTATAGHNASQTAYDTVTNPATGGGATRLPILMFGMIENGTTAGTFAIRLKSEVGSSAATVAKGSSCTYVIY